MSETIVTSAFAGSLTKEISQQPIKPGKFTIAASSGMSPEEALAQLDHYGIEWQVSDAGNLLRRVWQVGVERFVSPEKAAMLRPDKAMSKETDSLEWYSQHLPELRRQHAGQWIAIADNRLVAVAPTLPELMQKIQKAEVERPFIAQVPTKPSTLHTAYARQAF